MLLGVYNPFDLGMGSQAEQHAAAAAGALNDSARQVTDRRGVRVADAQGALEGQIITTTGMAGAQPDIHPTPRGHELLAAAILAEPLWQPANRTRNTWRV